MDVYPTPEEQGMMAEFRRIWGEARYGPRLLALIPPPEMDTLLCER